MQAKVRQGDELMKEGDKCGRTSLFKWTPDWEGAFLAYEKAALCYKVAKEQDRCKQAHLKAADAQYRCNLIHGAAKNFEAAGHCAREQRNYEEAVQHLRRAASLYAENGTVEKAAEVLTQAARSLEDTNADAAADLLLEAVDMLEPDAKRGAGDALKRATALLIRSQRIDRAIDVMGKEIEFLVRTNESGKSQHELHRTYLALEVLHLHQNDFVAADRTYNQALSCEGFVSSNEGRAAAELLDAFEKSAPEVLQACLSRQAFTFMDGPVLRLARGLQVDSGAATTPPTSDVQHSTTSFTPQATSSLEKEEEEEEESDQHSILL
jgi:tetratricopeptide (TPR) repeat protein